jgi:hypothetical protein
MAIICTATDYHLRSSQATGLQSTQPFSISVWINAIWNSGSRLSFVGVYGPTTDVALGPPVTALQIGTTAGASTVDCWTWGGSVLIGGVAMPAGTYNNAWVHFIYTFNGTNHILYRNGIQVATNTTAQIPGFLNQVYINGFPGGVTSEVATHQVDSYTLWTRTLTADEIITIYNAQGARHGITNNQLARYEFDEGALGDAATSVVDMTGRGNTLTNVGAGTPIAYIYSGGVANSNFRPVQ